MREIKLTEAHEQCLRDQLISDEQPGAILRDFRMLLEFLGSRPVEAGGKYNLLPIKLIGELDERLSRPLRLEMKRPQIRSHPYIQGLNLLLRATGLSRIEGAGDKARLVLDPVMMTLWDRLNPTERYFNLLEAWLLFGRGEMIGESERGWGGMSTDILQVWRMLPARGIKFNLAKPEDFHLPGLYRKSFQVALLDLFGLMDVLHAPRPVTPWVPAAVKHKPFGDAVLTIIASAEFDFLGLNFLTDEDNDPEDEDEDEDEEDEPDEAQFGLWQPLFEPYFPEWRENLELPVPEFRNGEFIFRVSLGKVWRRLAMSAKDTLEDLLDLILHSVGFDSDHLYEFNYRDHLGASVSASDPRCEDGPWASEIKIGALPIQPGQSMGLTYDFGDNWKFQVKLERIEPPEAKPKKSRILESHGEAPPQYPSWDDDEF